MITAEVAVYPLKTSKASEVIRDSIKTLTNKNIEYSVSPVNTEICGTEKEVFQCLEQMYNTAEKSGGEVNMVVTISNSTK